MTLRLILLLLLLLSATALGAQQRAPFGTMEVMVGGVGVVGLGLLEDYWRAEHGGAIRVSTPFYVGSAAATIQILEFDARSPDQPPFGMRTYALEWSLEGAVAGGVTLGAGIQAGAASMTFDDDGRFWQNVDENEFVAGLQAGLSVGGRRGAGATLRGTHRRLFTRHPIDLTSLTVGIHYTFTTPAPIRDFLQ